MEILEKPVSVVAQYTPFYAQLSQLEEDNAALAFDYESKKGNKEARSHINTLRLTKGALDRTRKAAKEESLRIGRSVDSEAKEIEARIEVMIRIHQTKIDEIEQRETDRIDHLKNKLAHLSQIHADSTAAQYRFHISTLESVVIDDTWQEFVTDAAKAKDAALTEHRRLLAERETRDAEAAELEKLRAESAARMQKEREDAIAQAATDRAKVQADQLAKAEREASERRELELNLKAETAERRRVEAEQRAEKDARDAKERAEKAQAKAVQNEKDLVASIAKAESDAQAKREANLAHKTKINRAALAAMVAGGLSEDCAKECIKLIVSGKIPAIQINY